MDYCHSSQAVGEALAFTMHELGKDSGRLTATPKHLSCKEDTPLKEKLHYAFVGDRQRSGCGGWNWVALGVGGARGRARIRHLQRVHRDEPPIEPSVRQGGLPSIGSRSLLTMSLVD